MSIFRAKLSYEEFMNKARNYPVPFKFFVKEANKITLYMHYVVGNAAIVLLYWSEIVGDEETLKKVEDELNREGFKHALSFAQPTPFGY